MRWILAVVLLAGMASVQAADGLAYRIVAEYPHDTGAFTEGLAICDGDLVESDGLYGHSQIEIRTLHTGRVLARRTLPRHYFGEGTTCAGGRILQLTWREGTIFVYDRSLELLASYPYHDEGWGLTWDGRRLIASDGSARLRFLDPRTFALLGTIEVHDGAQTVTRLNELEWAKGRIYANIWHDDRIAVIDPASGSVTAWLDLSGLLDKFPHGPDWNEEDVLNGIAWDPDSGHFFVTGKDWPKMFEIVVAGVGAETAGTQPK